MKTVGYFYSFSLDFPYNEKCFAESLYRNPKHTFRYKKMFLRKIVAVKR